MKKKKSDETHKNKTQIRYTNKLSNRAKVSHRESEEKYQTIIENIQEGYFELDLAGNFTFFNDSTCLQHGYSKEELMGMNYREYTDEETAKKLFQAFNKVYTTGIASHIFEYKIIRRDGTRRQVEAFASLKKDSSGKPTGFRGTTRDATERTQMEESLRRSEEKYRSILEDMRESYFEVDLAGNFTFFNDSFCRILKYTPEEMMGMNYRQYFDEETAKKIFQVFNKVYKTGEPAEVSDWQMIRKDGIKIYVEESMTLIKDSSGKLTGFRGMVRDVTDRKQAEDNLRQSEEKHRTILENIAEGYYEVDLAGNFTFFNEPMCRILGYSKEEMMGMNNRQYTDKNFSKKLFETFNKVYKTGKTSKEFNWQIVRKDGVNRYIEASISLLKDSFGKPVGFRGIVGDITERKETEEKLRDEELRFRALAEQSSDIILLVNKEGFITYENQAVSILGVNPEDRIGVKALELVHPDDVKLVTDSFLGLFSNANTPFKKGEIRLCHKDGSWYKFEAIGSSLVRNNIVESVIVNLRDITERKMAEEKLQKTLENLRKSYGITIQVLVAAVEMRDPYTAGHQSRSADIARFIAQELGLPHDKIDGIRMAGSIHDIGKLSVPSEILSRPTKLTHIEFSMIKEHAQIGYEMLKDVESPWPLAEIVYQHHERMDGSGYPRNLKGDEIIIEARIMAVSDVVEAMSSHRPYRASLGIEAALEEIEKNKGILYDKDVVNACLRLFREKGYKLT